MKPITVDDLPKYSPWPQRLLGLEEFHPGRFRDKAYVLREYEEKYKRLLGTNDMQEVLRRDLGNEVVAMSRGDHLYATSLPAAMHSVQAEHLTEIGLRAGEAASVVDLGCGYGLLLSRLRMILGPEKILLGGDLSPSALAVAAALFADDLRLVTGQLDLLSDAYAPMAAAPGPCLVVTSFALHQLPSAGPFIETLSQYREQIAAIVCLEPEEDAFGDSLLGLMRKRYGQVNGYSADLVRCLRERSDVAIETVRANLVGSNALLPGTLTVWRFL